MNPSSKEGLFTIYIRYFHSSIPHLLFTLSYTKYIILLMYIVYIDVTASVSGHEKLQFAKADPRGPRPI